MPGSDVSHLIVDELSIETGDEPLGKGVDGFVFKGYALPNSRGRFKRKVPVAVKVGRGGFDQVTFTGLCPDSVECRPSPGRGE